MKKEISCENCKHYTVKEVKEILELAMGEAERTGEWIDKGEYAECPICGAHSEAQFDGVELIPLKTNFCSNCGARLIGGDSK